MTEKIYSEPWATYHARRATCLTYHALADFNKSPLIYHQKKNGIIADQDRPAYRIGRATHTMLLEGMARFSDEYVIGGPINPKTGKTYGADTKAFSEWMSEFPGKDVVSEEDYGNIQKMWDSFISHPIAGEFRFAPEVTIRGEYLGHLCQSRIDGLADDSAYMIELKTCEDIDNFVYDARKYKYTRQVAFYREMVRLATGQEPIAYIVAVEKKAPHRCGVWNVDATVLNVCKSENEDAMRQLAECAQTGTWPSGYESLMQMDEM